MKYPMMGGQVTFTVLSAFSAHFRLGQKISDPLRKRRELLRRYEDAVQSTGPDD